MTASSRDGLSKSLPLSGGNSFSAFCIDLRKNRRDDTRLIYHVSFFLRQWPNKEFFGSIQTNWGFAEPIFFSKIWIYFSQWVVASSFLLLSQLLLGIMSHLSLSSPTGESSKELSYPKLGRVCYLALLSVFIYFVSFTFFTWIDSELCNRIRSQARQTSGYMTCRHRENVEHTPHFLVTSYLCICTKVISC